ncbi:hypothetical protein J6Y50_01825 [bacterium]|nr:hypothetical protein [bacterium]
MVKFELAKTALTVLLFLSFFGLSAQNDDFLPKLQQVLKKAEECYKSEKRYKSIISELQKEITELKTENNKLKEAAKSDDTKSKLAEAQVQITSLGNQLAEKQIDLTTEKAENKNLKNQLKEKEKEIGKLKADKKKLANGERGGSGGSRESELEEEIEKLTKQIKEKDTTIKSQKEEIGRLKKNPSDMQKPAKEKSDLSLLIQICTLICSILVLVILSVMLIKNLREF